MRSTTQQETAEDDPFPTWASAEQREAIQTTDGPLLIIAGPGSGKRSIPTRVGKMMATTGAT